MCRRAEHSFGATVQAPGGARRLVADVCRRWGLDEIADDVVLSVSELATNAVLHARSPFVVTLAVTQGAIEVAIQDREARPHALQRQSRLQPAEASVLGGRGLFVVEALVDQWGVGYRPEGKVVWYRMNVPADWYYRDDCPCAAGDGDRTASGRPVHHIPGPWDVGLDGLEPPTPAL